MDDIRMTKKFLYCLELVVLLLLFTGCGEKITGKVEDGKSFDDAGNKEIIERRNDYAGTASAGNL